MSENAIIVLTAVAAAALALVFTRGMRPAARAFVMLIYLGIAAFLLPVFLWIPVYAGVDFSKQPVYPPGFKDQIYFTREGAAPMLPVNKDGLIADRRYTPGASGKHRVVILGDSFAAGYGLTYAATLGARLQSELGADYEVINGAMFGSNAEMQVEYFFNALEQYKPRTILIRFRRDDVMPLAEQLYLKSTANIIARYARIWPAALKNAVFKTEMYLIREKFWKLYRKNPREANNRNMEIFYSRLGLYTAANDVRVLLITDTCPLAYADICKSASARAEMLGWETINPIKAVPPGDPAMIIPGDGHPSAAANERLAELLAPLIKPK